MGREGGHNTRGEKRRKGVVILYSPFVPKTKSIIVRVKYLTSQVCTIQMLKSNSVCKTVKLYVKRRSIIVRVINVKPV